MDTSTSTSNPKKRQRCRCDCGQDITGLSAYHVSEHKRSARHRKAVDAAKNAMSRHIGFHILAGDCVNYPCDFCGIGSTCSIQLKETSQHHKGPHSDCKYFYKFSLTSATKVTARSPCTNVPMQCTIC